MKIQTQRKSVVIQKYLVCTLQFKKTSTWLIISRQSLIQIQKKERKAFSENLEKRKGINEENRGGIKRLRLIFWGRNGTLGVKEDVLASFVITDSP